MSEEQDLELLDLNDADDAVDESLPDAAPFVAPRPHRPWLLLTIGVAIIVLAVFIIVRVVSNNSSSSIEVDLGAPVMVEQREPEVIMPMPRPMPMPEQQMPARVNQPAPMPQPIPQPIQQPVQPAPQPVQVARPAPQPAPQPVQVAPVQENQNVRVIEDRKDVTFNPERAVVTPKPIPAPAPREVKTPAKPKPAPKPAAQKVANGGWYVQFGSYSTRAAAEAAEKKIRSGHQNLFAGKQFVILAAVLPNGNTTYRLRVAFATSGDANGFCRNAKSDGLDCYVAK